MRRDAIVGVIWDRIKLQSETYKWTFLFLGANQDAIATAAQLVFLLRMPPTTWMMLPACTHHISPSHAELLHCAEEHGPRDGRRCEDLAAPMSQILKRRPKSEANKKTCLGNCPPQG